MSEVITLKQFDGSTVTPKDDAIMYDSFSGETGLLEGCDLTHTGAGQIRIGAGRGIIKGRQFVVQEHTINVTLSSDSDIPGRVYIRMDLSDTSEPVKILHVTAAVLPELEQDENCNNDNGVYEIELGTYIASKLTISNLEKTINRISPKLAKSMVVDNPNDVGAVTEEGYPVGCKALNGILGGIRFGVDADGNYGYIKAGADTVTPFKSGAVVNNFSPTWVVLSTGSDDPYLSVSVSGSTIDIGNSVNNDPGQVTRFVSSLRSSTKYSIKGGVYFYFQAICTSNSSENFYVTLSFCGIKKSLNIVSSFAQTVQQLFTTDADRPTADEDYIYITVHSASHTYGYPGASVSYNINNFIIIS